MRLNTSRCDLTHGPSSTRTCLFLCACLLERLLFLGKPADTNRDALGNYASLVDDFTAEHAPRVVAFLPPIAPSPGVQMCFVQHSADVPR